MITLLVAFNFDPDNLACLQGNSILDARSVGGEDLPDAIFFQANHTVGFVWPAHVLLAWGQRRLDGAFTFPGMLRYARSATRQQQAHLVNQVVVGLELVIVAQAGLQ